MSDKSRTVLIVTLYTKRIGIAVFRSGDLMNFQVVTFKRPRTPRSMRAETLRRISPVVERFGPDEIVVNAHEAGIASRNRREILRTLQEIIFPQQIHEQSFAAVRQGLLSRDDATLRDTFALVILRYPELGSYAVVHGGYQHSHITPALTAVAMGHFLARSPASRSRR